MPKAKIKLESDLFCFDGLQPDSGTTIKLTISAKDNAHYGALSRERWAEGTQATVVVTDIPTKKRWQVKRADCGAGCFCACEAVPAGANITDTRLTEQELANVLASLRYFQANLHDIDALDMDHFKSGASRLSAPEIDALCRRLNHG